MQEASRHGRPRRLAVTLLVSGRCNLRCSYCYQSARRVPRVMPWPAVEAALDAIRRSGAGEVTLGLNGGEPLLATGLVRRIVRCVEATRPRGLRVRWELTTNGMLLTAEVLDFLVGHDFSIKVSFDGVAQAQGERGPESFGRLDALLHMIADRHPGFARRNLKIAVTLLARTIPTLAESVRYFLDASVSEIRVFPQVTWDPDWHPALRGVLEEQVAEVLEASLRHWKRSASVPVIFLAAGPRGGDQDGGDGFLCGAVRGRGFCVDTGGHAWACPMFASSLRELPPLAAQAARVIDLGDVRDGGVMARLDGLVRGGRAPATFTGKRSKHSPSRSCAECEVRDECFVCPAAISSIPDNVDPNLIPDFHCAFNQVTIAGRRRFRELTGDREAVTDSVAVRQALSDLLEKLTAPRSSTPQPKKAREDGHRVG